MKLQSRIYTNLVRQLLIGYKTQDLQKKMRQLEQESASAVGAMSLLNDMYGEETGRPLQEAINSDPEWADMMKKADAEAQELFKKEQIDHAVNALKPVVQPPIQKKEIVAVEENPTTVESLPVEEKTLPRLRRVDNNKTVEPKESQNERSREPIKVVITDAVTSAPANTKDDDPD